MSDSFFQPPWTVACQALLSMGFSRHEYWSGLPFPSRGDLPNSGIEPASLKSPALAYGFFFFFFFLTTKPPGKPQQRITWPQKCWSWAILNQTVIPKGSCYLQHCIPRLVLGTQQRLNKCWLNKQSHLATMRSLGKGHFASPILPWSTSAPPNSV